MNKEKMRDQLMNADFKQVSKAVMDIANNLQSYDIHLQTAALAFCFLTYARLTKQNVQDIFTCITNLAQYGEKLCPEFKAMEKYLKHEVIKT